MPDTKNALATTLITRISYTAYQNSALGLQILKKIGNSSLTISLLLSYFSSSYLVIGIIRKPVYFSLTLTVPRFVNPKNLLHIHMQCNKRVKLLLMILCNCCEIMKSTLQLILNECQKWICLINFDLHKEDSLPYSITTQWLIHTISDTTIISKYSKNISWLKFVLCCGIMSDLMLLKIYMYIVNHMTIHFTISRSCHGSVDKTTDSQPWGPWFKSAGSSSSAHGKGTLSSLPSPLERT